MARQSDHEVLIEVHDPFAIWEKIRKNMESILPLAVNVKRINGSHWHKNINFPAGFRTGFREGGEFNCTYVMAKDRKPENSSRNIGIDDDEPNLYLYILPPMEYSFFKRSVKYKLKQFMLDNKSKPVILIYGICNKEDKNEQKSNLKTIELLRRMHSSLSLSPNRLCLVPMLGLSLLNDDGITLTDENKEIDTFAFKNWESLKVSMGDCISENMANRLMRIGEDIRKTQWRRSDRMDILYEAILHIFLKCSLITEALDGYISLFLSIETDAKCDVMPNIAERAPFIYYIGSTYSLEEDRGCFDIYQYLCYMAVKLLGSVKSTYNMLRTCHVILRFCMVTLTAVRKNSGMQSLIWSITLIKESERYISEKEKEFIGISENNVMKSTTFLNEIDEDETRLLGNTSSTIKDKVEEVSSVLGNECKLSSLNESMGLKCERNIVPTSGQYTPNPLCELGVLHHKSGYKTIRRCLGLLHNMSYKLIKKAITSPCGTFEDELLPRHNDPCTMRYYKVALDILDALKSHDSRMNILTEALNEACLNFSQGGLPRFCKVMTSINNSVLNLNTDPERMFTKKDTDVLDWDPFHVCDKKKYQIFTWFVTEEPNFHLKDPLRCVKRLLSANINDIFIIPNMCMSPCHMEDENVNNYLRLLREAKMETVLYEDDVKYYGQVVRYESTKKNYAINVYSLEDIKNVSIRIFLRELAPDFSRTQVSKAAHYEEINLFNVNISAGHNVFELGHVFKKKCNYVQDYIIIDSEDMHVVQRAYTPIPLGLLNGVVGTMKAMKVPSKYILSSLMLPTNFIYEPLTDVISIKARLCGDSTSCSSPRLIAGSRNFVTFHVRGFKGGVVYLLTSSISYDIGASYIICNGHKSPLIERKKTPEGTQLVIPENGTSNYVICISAELAEGSHPERIYQSIRLCSDSIHEISVEFVVIPPFSRELWSTGKSRIQVVLEPTFHAYTQIDKVIINGEMSMQEPTLLERGDRYFISVDNSLMDYTEKHEDFITETLEYRRKDIIATVHTADGEDADTHNEAGCKETCSLASEKEHKDETKDSCDTIVPYKKSDPRMANEVIVQYRLLRHTCVHQHVDSDAELQLLCGQLEYRFDVPIASENDVFVSYKAPPFCILNQSFDVTIVIRSKSEVCFDYELETNDSWFIEGPVRAKNQFIQPLEAVQLKFKIMALSCVHGSLMKLPSIRFWRLRAPVVHKEIFIIK